MEWLLSWDGGRGEGEGRACLDDSRASKSHKGRKAGRQARREHKESEERKRGRERSDDLVVKGGIRGKFEVSNTQRSPGRAKGMDFADEETNGRE